jgi:hypothetical protein
MGLESSGGETPSPSHVREALSKRMQTDDLHHTLPWTPPQPPPPSKLPWKGNFYHFRQRVPWPYFPILFAEWRTRRHGHWHKQHQGAPGRERGA